MIISYQFLSLLAMIVSGVATGFLVECFRDIAYSLRPRAALRQYRFFLEIILWVVLGCASYLLLYYLRDGNWRIYDPLAQIVGIGFYELWFRSPLIVGRRMFVHLIINPVWWVIHLFITIIRYIVRIIFKIIMLFVSPVIKLMKKMNPRSLIK